MALIQINTSPNDDFFQPFFSPQDPLFLQRKRDKEQEVDTLKSILEKVRFDIHQKISSLSLAKDKDKLLHKCFVDALKRDQAFIDCNMSKSEGYRQLNCLLNEIHF